MIKNYFTVAIRNIKKNKVFSFINILGLAIGIAAFLLITFYVSFETSYDKFHTDADRIYRVTLEQYLNNEVMISSAENYPGVGPAMLKDLQEVESYARLYNMGYKNNVILTWEDASEEPVKYKHRKLLYADSSFIPMFGYEMIEGDAKTALSEPLSLVISEKYAKMYFGDTNPIGKMLRLQDDDYNDELCKVTGVFKDLPQNTHLKFDILISYKTLFTRGDWATSRYDESWERKDMYTYVKLKGNVTPAVVASSLPQIIDRYSPTKDDASRTDVMSLQPLTDIHLHSNLTDESEPNGKASSVYALGMIAFFILIIAWVNYINLSTAKATKRANEVGVRKSFGAFKHQLVYQFLTESALINIAALLLSFLIIILALPYFSEVSGISFTAFDLIAPLFAMIAFSVWLIGSILSGLYPAFVLSSFKPVSVLKGKTKTGGYGVFLRKGLVVFQFCASICLIAGTIIVYNQIDFMTNRDLGFDIDQILVVERPGIASKDRNQFVADVDFFRNEVTTHPNVMAITTSATIPGKKREYKAALKRYGTGDDQEVTLRLNSMDYSFTDVYNMKVLAGRVFSEDYPNDPDTAVVLTKSGAEILGFKNPEDAVGQTLTAPAYQWNPIVVGVVNDYHQESLQKAKDPIVFYCTAYNGEFYSMRVNTNNLRETINHLEDSWEKAFAGNPFQYFFLDDYFNRQYENEQQFGSLFTSFSVLAILVGCLGLFGLSSYTAEQKTKEIGIRKVLGSSIPSIFVHLTKEYLLLISIAIILSVPITYYMMQEWLNSFAYKINIDVLTFILTSIMVVLVAIITVSFQTIKAARKNPVEALKYD